MTGWNKTIGGGGFHHVSLRVHDFEASVKFYCEALGFREHVSWGQGEQRAIMLDTGDGNFLELFAGGSAGVKPEGCMVHFALRTDSCDKAIERARKAGAEVTMEPKDIDIPSTPVLPVRIAFCKGPDGESIEFLQSRSI